MPSPCHSRSPPEMGGRGAGYSRRSCEEEADGADCRERLTESEAERGWSGWGSEVGGMGGGWSWRWAWLAGGWGLEVDAEVGAGTLLSGGGCACGGGSWVYQPVFCYRIKH